MDNTKDEVVGHLEYRADLFEKATAIRFVRHLEVGPAWVLDLCSKQMPAPVPCVAGHLLRLQGI